MGLTSRNATACGTYFLDPGTSSLKPRTNASRLWVQSSPDRCSTGYSQGHLNSPGWTPEGAISQSFAVCSKKETTGLDVDRKTAIIGLAGWSSSVAREAHNLEVVGSNPAPAIFSIPNGFQTSG
jgi:hypothetical protein